MSEHITKNELNRYFDIVVSNKKSEDNEEFMTEIDAHAAECEDCFEKMEAMRLLLRSFLSDTSLSKAFINSDSIVPLYKPAFDIKKAFAGIKVVKVNLAGKIQYLADTLSDKMNAVFVPCGPALSVARGDKKIDVDESSLNNLLYSDMEIPLDDGRKITLRCRQINNSAHIRLFVYSNFEVNFTLTEGINEIEPIKKEYDSAIGENIWMFELSGESFELKVK